jgi:hypothetical protein
MLALQRPARLEGRILPNEFRMKSEKPQILRELVHFSCKAGQILQNLPNVRDCTSLQRLEDWRLPFHSLQLDQAFAKFEECGFQLPNRGLTSLLALTSNVEVVSQNFFCS